MGVWNSLGVCECVCADAIDKAAESEQAIARDDEVYVQNNQRK